VQQFFVKIQLSSQVNAVPNALPKKEVVHPRKRSIRMELNGDPNRAHFVLVLIRQLLVLLSPAHHAVIQTLSILRANVVQLVILALIFFVEYLVKMAINSTKQMDVRSVIAKIAQTLFVLSCPVMNPRLLRFLENVVKSALLIVVLLIVHRSKIVSHGRHPLTLVVQFVWRTTRLSFKHFNRN